MPGLLIYILMLLPFLIPDFFFLLLDLRMCPMGDERKVVLDLMALSRQLFESPPTLMIEGRRI
jgi:hypothetical protein